MEKNDSRRRLLLSVATAMILTSASALPCWAGSREVAGPGRTSDHALVSLSRQRSTVRVGDRVLIKVNIRQARDVGHVPFHLEFDSSVLRFEESGEGTFLSRDRRATVFLATPNRSGSSVVVGLSRLGGEVGVGGNGELCWLAFTAVGKGDARLTFTHATLRDADNRSVPVTFQTTKVIID
jgi:hypothetical protein